MINCFALDLIDDPQLIAEYEKYHYDVWPEIIQHIEDSGITSMEIYRTGNRLFMITQTNEHFSFEGHAKPDEVSEKVQKWEQLMWKYQQALPGSKPDEKWILMKRVFSL